MPGRRVPRSYVELHIEQGPVLEDEGVTIGVVTGVQGISWIELTIEGQSAHAGTTPMRLRHDPMVVAAGVIRAMREICPRTRRGPGVHRRSARCLPESDQRVPSNVVMTLDIRNTDEHLLQLAEMGVTEPGGFSPWAKDAS